MPGERPFVFINTAVTADGKIDTVERKGAAISSATDKERVDRLRAESDAVMVGGRTLLQEDPRLTVKSPALRGWRLERGLPENPMKVGIVSLVGKPDDGPMIESDGKFLNAGPAPVVVFTTGATASEQIARLRSKGAEVIVMEGERVDLTEALGRLYALGVRRLMVEGGGTLNAELLRAGLVDEVHLYIAPLIFGGANAPTLADGTGLSREAAINLDLLSVDPTEEGGIIVRYAVRGSGPREQQD
jgi:2,5-diamino-6-(ribosylamino)-4(3H)-pyrimidinone 5'-phosphate reductase